MASDRKVVGSGFESLGGHFGKLYKSLEDISILGLFLLSDHMVPEFCPYSARSPVFAAVL